MKLFRPQKRVFFAIPTHHEVHEGVHLILVAAEPICFDS